MFYQPVYTVTRLLGLRGVLIALLLGVVVLCVAVVQGLAVPYLLSLILLGGYFVTGVVASVRVDRRVLEGLLAEANDFDHADLNNAFSGALADLDLSLLASATRIRRGQELHQSAVSEIGYSAHELSASAEQLAANITQQSQATGTIAAAVTEITHSIEEVTARIHAAYELTEVSNQQGQSGASIMADVRKKMEDVATYIEQTYRLLASLDEQTVRVSSISSVIRSIAEQTNLLALNAAIEAARAGEHGRGFAVVAEEVRALATRSHSSAQEISHTIEDVQTHMAELKHSMGDVVGRSEETLSLAANAESTLVEIAGNTANVCDMVNAIMQAAEQQSFAAHEISANIEEVAQVADENSRVAIQASNIARHLYKLCQMDGGE